MSKYNVISLNANFSLEGSKKQELLEAIGKISRLQTLSIQVEWRKMANPYYLTFYNLNKTKLSQILHTIYLADEDIKHNLEKITGKFVTLKSSELEL